MRHSIYVHLYVGLLVLAAIALCFWVFPRFPFLQGDLVPLICFTAFLIGAELFEIRTSMGGKWLPSGTINVAIWISLGPTVAILTQILGVTIGEGLIKRRPPIRTVFNIATMVLSVGTAACVYHALPWGANLRSPLFLVCAIISSMVYSLVNMMLAAFVFAISEGRSIGQVWRTTFGWHFVTGALTAPIAAFLVFSYKFAGLWSLVLFGIPLITIWQTHKSFEEMKEAHKNTVAALTTALEADEPYTHGHSYRVARYAVAIGRRLGMSAQEIETLEYAGLLHDIGKIAITNDIVCKPARLTKEEFDILSAHPAIGGEIVAEMKFLRAAAHLVRHHHERPDGQGYPDGLQGDEISLGSHILNLCDAIDAMTSNRPYRAALTLDQCLGEVLRFRGTQFDTRVADVFAEMVREGQFEILEHADGNAQEIQRILRESAGLLPPPPIRSQAA
jgi:hypothetical protein